MKTEHVAGTKKKGEILLYALSTCVWCKKTKQFLEDNSIDYYYVFVDLVPEKEREEVLRKMGQWNPDQTFPTMVIDNKDCIIGFRPEDMKKRFIE